jgi:RHS repeat-associated protein
MVPFSILRCEISFVNHRLGNLTTRGDQTITWDVENRPVSITDGESTSTFVYDGDGNRALKTEGGETILYINLYYEKNLTTGEVITSYYLGGKLVATKTGDTLEYVHQDHLSGTVLVSDSSGELVDEISYYPYGSTRSGDVPTDKKFAGQRLDGTGLYYYDARYYDPTIGRFISPDPITHSEPLPLGQIISDLTVYCTTVEFYSGQTRTPITINHLTLRPGQIGGHGHGF